MHDELIIIDSCQKNDRKAQEILYKKYFSSMYVMCKRYTQDQEVICTIVNDAFLKVFKNIHNFDHRAPIEAWIRRITFNTLSDHFRKENKNIKYLLLDNSQSFESVQFNTTEPDLYDHILHSINSLDSKQKEVFVKYAIEGYSHKEISQCLTIPEGTSKWYLSEARKQLQRLLFPEKFIKTYE